MAGRPPRGGGPGSGPSKETKDSSPTAAKKQRDEELTTAQGKARENELVTEQLWQRVCTVLGEDQAMTAGLIAI